MSLCKIKAHFEIDLTQDVWFEIKDFDKDFCSEVEEARNITIFSLGEAITVLCIIGSQMDSIAKEEITLLFRLYDNYNITLTMAKWDASSVIWPAWETV